VFGSKEVSYLGFCLTEQGIKPGIDKLKAVRNALPPSNVHEIRQFLGLCNFFQAHVRNFAQLTSPLTTLTKKECSWKGGQLPPDALQAFLELQTYLCLEPIVDYPRSNRPYTLIIDASLGDHKKPGGLGAILTQINPNGEHCVIAYASRKLQKHKCNYTPFLLEMQAAIWGMDHFSTNLRGRKFTLVMDHRPLEKLGKVHTKTLNQLQEIIYKKGSKMPTDYISRNLITAFFWDALALQNAQNADPFLKALKNFYLTKNCPTMPNVNL
jgi:RNase H-like domain found in reverse transcriptase